MARKSIRYNFQPNALFRGGPIVNYNACVGENGGPYDLIDYGKGFFDGAQEIVVAVKERNGIVDLLVYPICFSFRHGIELYLKAIVKIASQFNQSGREYEKNHSINEYWRMIAEEFAELEDGILDRVQIGVAGDIIADFVQIDPTGQVFRYPEDIKGNVHLTGLGLINVEVLSDGMKILHGLLDSWYFRFEDLLQYRRETAAG